MPESKPILSFDTQGGALLVFENKVRITRSGCLSFLNHGAKGDKDIPISSVTAIQLKEPGLTGSGYLQFNLSGGDTSTGGVFDAAEDENTVMLQNQEQYKNAKEAKQTIERLMYEDEPAGGNGGSTGLSDVEELEKYHDLLEKGAITEEEFEQKKKEVLGGGEGSSSESNLEDGESQTGIPEEVLDTGRTEISGEEPLSSKGSEEESQGRSWYDRTWVVVLLSFLFWPVGAYALYKNNRMSTAGKFGTGVLCAFMALATIGAGAGEKGSSTESSSTETTSENVESFDGGNYGLFRNRGMVYHVINLPPSTAESRTVEGYVLNEDYGCWDENEYQLENVEAQGDGKYHYNMEGGDKIRIRVDSEDETTVYVGPSGNKKEYNELARGDFTDIMSKTCR